jgi:hypothetical protein
MEDDKLEHEARIRIKRPSRSMPYPMMKKKKKHTVQCICSSAHEEFGTMVQCDECLHWLHSDCLELTDQALKQSFRCPACFVASESGKPVASLSWRYLAQWKSQRLADTQSDMTSDEEDETEYHHGPTKLRLQTKSHLRYSTIEEEYNDDDDDDDDENDSTDAVESYGPLTPVDLAELSPLDGHHSEDSTSEASTPDGKLYLADPFETPDNVGDMALDSESLEILSRLAYLQSLESVRKELFAPNASDVFLCENM